MMKKEKQICIEYHGVQNNSKIAEQKAENLEWSTMGRRVLLPTLPHHYQKISKKIHRCKKYS